ncbi:rho guanine nucleotide exchange factor 11 isoform X9 [Monodelphis domestica]|uniref:rho guanine nucleotide exchange factor 11 isoform X9 n=1 Tax=Monodelphis domestica TaxID=13616 RepID=UPI0024E1A293|nr:rho guanine nucleotide exchange factor 11 isoform X9 [Monodelphis domestica]XP_056672203.1 rho guanine nucleotide exchange factor 11 isoform X9 [Monodelphis domestica]
MSVRLPQTIDRLSSLSSLSDSAPEQKTPDHQGQPSDSCETTGLVQRCVIIQKDQHGFGFTVSGDRIVLVQSVRPGGAAMKAGVKEGDRIIKVNGTMVTNSSHLEVVKLIKSGAYVALTLLGSSPSSVGVSGLQQDLGSLGTSRAIPVIPPPPPPPPLPPLQHITGPKPLQDPEVQKHATQILQNMLRQEEKELQHFREVYSRNPASLLEEQIEGARRRVTQLQRKIQQGSGGSVDILQMSDTNPANLKSSEGRHSLDSQDGDSGLDSGTERFPSLSESLLNRNSILSDPGLDSPRTSPVIMAKVAQHHRRQGSDTTVLPTTEQGLEHSPKPLIIGPEEDYDPGYFNNESDTLFQNLEKLKYRPAHLGVFLRYIFSQADPNPLLFYLCAEVYLQTYPKDSRGLGKTIWAIFLEKNSPLRVKIPEALQAEIDLHLRNNEDIRSALSEAQEAIKPEIQEQIQDYRTKRTMGLGSLYGENDLLDLDGDPQRERQVAEKQLAALGDILSKYEEVRSISMDFALNTYMSHAGIRFREARPSTAEKSQTIPDKDKWLPFFPKTKKSSNAKKEKDALEDKKRNPILKYIGKPKSSSQNIKPGNVRNIIQHFENNQQYDSPEPGMQRLSTGSFPEDLLESESSRSEIRLGRSESLKGREEMKKSRKAENVPRSRSDVDMDAAAEATRLHQSASSSASSLSTRSLENPTPPFTPKMGRRSIESPSLGYCTDALLPHLLEDDLGQLSDLEPEPDTQNWQHTVGKDVVAGLSQREIDRQEVINELFVTEASHLRTLRVLDLIFYQRMKKENLMPREELARLFPNLPELIEIHNSWCEAMKKLREEGPVIKEISDLMLARFDGAAREELQQVAAQFCSSQSIALELIKTKQRKESRFQLFMQEAESNPQCRRLQLKDLIVSEMQRLTKYPLLLENIIKYTDGGSSEYQKLCRARDQCREILKYVNEVVKQTENRQRLESYQKRLDTTSLERASNPLAAEFKSLDLTTRRMIHEGPLAWRISKDKTVDLHVLLLEDLLVLLQKQDEKLLLKCHSKTSLGSSDNKQTFSPVLKLNAVLIRSVATDKRAFFIICTSELGPPQIYELVALTSLDKNMWMELLEGAVQNATRNPSIVPDPAHLTQPAPQQPSQHSSTPTSMGLSDSEASQGNDCHPEVELLPRGDGAQQWVNGKHQALSEEPKQEGSEEELVASKSMSSLGGGGLGIRTRSTIHLPLPGPFFMEGLADSALEDVETLRHLILWSLLPIHTIESRATVEPEDDLTPTPSVIGITSHPWDPGSPGQLPVGMEGNDLAPFGQMTSRMELEMGELDDAALSSLEHLPPRARNSGIWEPPELDKDITEEPPTTEAVEGYKVVRKAEVAGSNAVPALPECGKSETEPPEAGGGPNAAGNCFYVSMPTGPPESSTDPSDIARSSSQQDVPHSSPTEPEHQGGGGNERRGPSSAPSLALRDVGMIFRTIEQLTLKLNRLKDMETAHRELLKSLGAESSGGTTPVGGLSAEAAKWTESPPLPPAKESISSYSKDSHERGPGPAADPDSLLEDSPADTAISLGL